MKNSDDWEMLHAKTLLEILQIIDDLINGPRKFHIIPLILPADRKGTRFEYRGYPVRAYPVSEESNYQIALKILEN